jgi:hypothetical protein
MTVVKVRRRDDGIQQTTVRVGERVALAQDDAPGRTVAALPFDAHAA